MRAFERLLDDVLGARLVADHEERQAHEPHVVLGEDRRYVDALPSQRFVLGE